MCCGSKFCSCILLIFFPLIITYPIWLPKLRKVLEDQSVFNVDEFSDFVNENIYEFENDKNKKMTRFSREMSVSVFTLKQDKSGFLNSVRWLRRRTFDERFLHKCSKPVTQHCIRERTADAINVTHRYSTICIRGIDGSAMLVADRDQDHPYQLSLQCAPVSHDRAYFAYLNKFRRCHVPSMRKALVDFSQDLEVLTDSFEDRRDLTIPFSCATLKIAWANCVPEVMVSTIHEIVNWVLNQLSGLELSATEIPYEGISLVLEENEKANNALLSVTNCCWTVVVLSILLVILPFRKWTAGIQSKWIIPFRILNKIGEIITSLPFCCLGGVLSGFKSNRNWQTLFAYILDGKSWYSHPTTETQRNLSLIRSAHWDYFSCLLTALSQSERQHSFSLNLSNLVGINGENQFLLGLAAENGGVIEGLDQEWPKKLQYRITIFLSRLLTLLCMTFFGIQIVAWIFHTPILECFELMVDSILTTVEIFATKKQE